MDDIIGFVNRIYSKSGHEVNMREYAKKNLQWHDRIEKIIKFIESL